MANELIFSTPDLINILHSRVDIMDDELEVSSDQEEKSMKENSLIALETLEYKLPS